MRAVSSEFEQAIIILLLWAPNLQIDKFTGLSEPLLEGIRSGVLREKIPYMTQALAWAVQHPDADFAAVLPETPYPNNVIYRYLAILYPQFRELEGELGLLRRETNETEGRVKTTDREE